MDYTAVNQEEKNNQRKGAITSFVIHVALLILAVLPLLTFPDPPPGQSGVLVAFGDPEVGQGDDPGPPPPAAEEASEEEPDVAEEVDPAPEPPKPEKKKDPVKPKKEVKTDANSKEIALKKKKEEERKKKIREERRQKEKEAAAKKKAEREAARKKKAAEEKARKEREAAEAARKAEAEKWKNIGAAAGSGSGNTGTPGNQGQPDGKPDGKALEGVSTGSGEIGGNLGGRDVLYKPKISDNSQKTGNVVVKVCVDASGKVSSAKYTQSGSTTADSGLIKTAIKAAKKYRFDAGTIDKQCGTIKIKFRLK
ncbi:MAG: energy transducer TonB [Bacteroidota bacterium]